ncbi:restriction endonuclease subunit S [Alistipes sp.]|uniref:restriction endonuclease subunit S n=1 Tax=Alistipes sp. TaxID=1872444 RepID=UPI0023F258AC|nr:restriction endonuclease subunit S [Alistipes sp.]
MATKNNDKTLNVPHLRFPEFTGEWKKVRLGDNCNIQMCKRIMAAQTNTENGVPFYKIGTIGGKADAYISKELFDEYKTKYSFPRKGEVMITCAGTVGKCIIYNGEDSYYQDSNIVWIDNPNEILSNDFLYHLLCKVNWSHLNSTTIVRIYNDDLRNLKLYYPRHNEQKKITHFLQLINERIATQNKIIEKLESLIRGIYKTLLGESDQYRYLDELCEIKKGVQVNKEKLSEKGLYYVMNGGITPSGYYDLYNTEANTISISEGGNSCGYVQYNYTPFWSGGHCYTLENISNVVDNRYLFHYLKANELQIMSLRIGSGLPNIQKKDLSAFRIPLPALNKQINIAKALDALLYKITVDKNIYSTYKQQKEYLLQQMFI